MGIRSGFKKFSKAIFNFQVSAWLDYKNLKSYTNYFYRQFRNLYYIQPLSRTETFEEAEKRLELTSENLELQKKRYYFLFFFYLVISAGIFCYFLGLCLTGNFMGACMSFSMTLYALTFAFRYHFWCYQIQKRKLSCSFQEWLNDFVGAKVTRLIKKGRSYEK